MMRMVTVRYKQANEGRGIDYADRPPEVSRLAELQPPIEETPRYRRARLRAVSSLPLCSSQRASSARDSL